MKAYMVNSFTYQHSGGNPAGVVILDKAFLPDAAMQQIATTLNISETAFVIKDNGLADFEIRFFTPKQEIDLCGHATIASFYMLHRLGELPSNQWTVKTKSGVLQVLLKLEGDQISVNMQQHFASKEYIASSYEDALYACFSVPFTKKPEIWSTGVRDILYPIKSRELLNQMSADFKAIEHISHTLNCIGIHAFAMEGDLIYARNFAPLYGINEESATGTSNGALIAYLHHNYAFESDRYERKILQGEAMGQLSLIHACSVKHRETYDIWIGGHCHWVDTINL